VEEGEEKERLVHTVLALALNYGSFHVKSTQKNMTLTDFGKTWFLCSLSWDIHPQSVSALYVVWLQS